jgi:hypothetical protein
VLAANQREQDFWLAPRPVNPEYLYRLIFSKPSVARRFSVAPVLAENNMAFGLSSFHRPISAEAIRRIK